jgi:hypothetical protein
MLPPARFSFVRHDQRCGTILTMFSLSNLRTLGLVLATSSLFACLDKPYDTDGLGDFIGVFAVDAKRDANTCGEGPLGAPATWSFEMRLSREVGTIYWNNGAEYIQGKLDADGHSFTFDTTLIVDMRDENSAPWLPPCSVARRDQSSGKIADDDASLTGKLSYDFSPTQGSDCADLVTTDPKVFMTLPCGMAYTIEADRTSTTP